MRVLPIVFVLFIGFGVFAQTTDTEVQTTPQAKLSFAESVHEFGDITQGDRVEHVFSYTNTGTQPLILSNVQTTCGCTATNWSREPLAPGESGTITVNFNSAGKIGMQNKVVTITSNAVNNPERISITTNVLVKPADQ